MSRTRRSVSTCASDGLRPAGGPETCPATAPPPGRFPAYPASWYFLCRSRDLRAAPLGVDLFGRRLAAFRSSDGGAVALDARCAHMGADLSRGCLTAGRLRCPFHGWEYGPDGQCLHIPSQAAIPPFARQARFAAGERYGLVFVFRGPRPLFPLPGFADDAGPLVAGRPQRYMMDCPWYMFGANGFDLQHFSPVHGRELLGEPLIDSPAPFARRIRYRTRVTGSSAFDRLLRRFAGAQVDVSITAWAGNLILVSASFPRATSYILFATAPLEGDRTLVDAIVLVRRRPGWRRLLEPLVLRVRQTFTMAFVREDTSRIGRPVYRPGTLIADDQAMIDYYRWLADLPRADGEQE